MNAVHHSRHSHTRHSAAGGWLLATLALGLATPAMAQRIDPDPELFDGTRTKSNEPQKEEKQKADKWEEANLIVYDSNEQGSEQGGQGRVGFEGPGLADGVQGGSGMGMGLPLPMGGGGTSDKEGMPGMIPMGEQSTPTSGTQSNQPPGGAGGKPGDVPIGDSSQQIAGATQPMSKGMTEAPPAGGEPGDQSKGEDTTTIPKAAAGAQSGKRGGGVEKGDAMPTDI